MATDFKLLFYIRKTEVKADGTCPIMGRISIGKTMAQFSPKKPLGGVSKVKLAIIKTQINAN